MIKWRMNVQMAEKHLTNQDVIERTGLHPVTISKLKNMREMPSRINRETLEKLCAALDCQPGDLMKYDSVDR